MALSILLLSFVSAQATVSITPYPLDIQAGQNISITIAAGAEGVGNSVNIEKNGIKVTTLGTMCANSKCFNEKEFIFYVPSDWQGTYSVSYTEYVNEAGNIVARPAKSDFTVIPYVKPTEEQIIAAMTTATVTTLTITGPRMGLKYKCNFSQRYKCSQVGFTKTWVNIDEIKPCEGCSEVVNKCGSACPESTKDIKVTWTGQCSEQSKVLGMNMGTEIKLRLLISGIGDILGGLLTLAFDALIIVALIYAVPFLGPLVGSIGGALGLGSTLTFTGALVAGLVISAASLGLTHQTFTANAWDSLLTKPGCWLKGQMDGAQAKEACLDKWRGYANDFQNTISSKQRAPECKFVMYVDRNKACNAEYETNVVYWDNITGITAKEVTESSGWTECSTYSSCKGQTRLESVSCELCPRGEEDDFDGDCMRYWDLCPDTPEDERGIIDPNGCSPSQRDTDNDGVNDKLDECPNTPAGQTVKPDGCTEQQKPTPRCSDGTLYNNCSVSQPLYCKNGQLIDNCTGCGCFDNPWYACNKTTNTCDQICGCNDWKNGECGNGNANDCPVGKLSQYRYCQPNQCDNTSRCIDYESCSASAWQKVGKVGTGWINTLIKAKDGFLYAGTNTVYLGDYLTGNFYAVFKSADMGATWNKAGPIGQDIAYVNSLIEASDGTLYAATNGSVLKSNDKGSTWSKTGTLSGAPIVESLAEASNTIVASTYPGAFFTSSDKGATWTKATSPAEAKSVGKLTSYSNTLFAAACWETGKDWTGRTIYRAAVLVSYDGGRTWDKTGGAFLGEDDCSLTTIYVNDLYAGTRGSPGHIFKRGYSGWGWDIVGTLDGRDSIFTLFKGSNGYLYAGSTSSAVYRSTDNGNSWYFYGNFIDDGSSINSLFEIGNYIYAATRDGGIYKREIKA